MASATTAPASIPSHSQAPADADAVQRAALQLSDALAAASLDREFARLQPLISSVHDQLLEAQSSQVGVANITTGFWL